MKPYFTPLLRWSERYTNIDMVYFASGSFWQTFGQVVTGVLSFGLILLFANLVPKEIYGTYRYILSLAAILNVLTLTGMNQAVMQAVATGNESILRASVTYQLKWNSILTLAFLLAGGYYFLHNNWALGGSLLILSLCTPLTTAFNTYGAYLAGKREFRLNNLFGIISTLVYVGGTALAIMLSGEVIWLVAAYALTTLAANIVLYVWTLRRFKPPAVPLVPTDEVFAYGRKLTLIGIMGPVVSQLDNIILTHFWGPAQLAVYSLGMAIPNRLVPFIKSWVDIGFPKLAIKTDKEIQEVFLKRILLGGLVGAVFAAGYIVTAPYVFTYLMPSYLEAVFYSQLLALTFVFAMPNRYIGLLFTAKKLALPTFISNSIQNVIRILLYLALGIWGGILGLVIAQLICAALGLIINLAVWQISMRPASE